MRTINIELRTDGLHIDGYVNVTGKLSKPVITPHGKCIETVEERAFENALQTSGNVTVTLDHDMTHVYADTQSGTCQLEEDAIGLKASIFITDPTIIDIAKQGKLKGWSFGMYNVMDTMEQRADGELPVRHIKSLMLDHITLVKDKMPCYAATSIECRAKNDVEVETRAISMPIIFTDKVGQQPQKVDLSEYQNRINKLKSAK